jgi:hypothetical protein
MIRVIGIDSFDHAVFNQGGNLWRGKPISRMPAIHFQYVPATPRLQDRRNKTTWTKIYEAHTNDEIETFQYVPFDSD